MGGVLKTNTNNKTMKHIISDMAELRKFIQKQEIKRASERGKQLAKEMKFKKQIGL